MSDGLRDGRTGTRAGRFSASIAEHLDPSRPGQRERAMLRELIEERAGEPDEVQFLTAALTRRGEPLEFLDEAQLLRSLRGKAPERLGAILKAIDDYEAFCRPLTDAFNWLRYIASERPQQGADAADYLERAPTGELTERLRPRSIV